MASFLASDIHSGGRRRRRGGGGGGRSQTALVFLLALKGRKGGEGRGSEEGEEGKVDGGIEFDTQRARGKREGRHIYLCIIMNA